VSAIARSSQDEEPVPLVRSERGPHCGFHEDATVNAGQLAGMDPPKEFGAIAGDDDLATEVNCVAWLGHPTTLPVTPGAGPDFRDDVGNSELCGSGPRCDLSATRPFKRTRR
jgi:hypothetical protein